MSINTGSEVYDTNLSAINQKIDSALEVTKNQKIAQHYRDRGNKVSFFGKRFALPGIGTLWNKFKAWRYQSIANQAFLKLGNVGLDTTLEMALSALNEQKDIILAERAALFKGEGAPKAQLEQVVKVEKTMAKALKEIHSIYKKCNQDDIAKGLVAQTINVRKSKLLEKFDLQKAVEVTRHQMQEIESLAIKHQQELEKGFKTPAVVMGGGKSVSFDDIWKHRDPKPTFEAGKKWKHYSIKGAIAGHAAALIKERIADYKEQKLAFIDELLAKSELNEKEAAFLKDIKAKTGKELSELNAEDIPVSAEEKAYIRSQAHHDANDAHYKDIVAANVEKGMYNPGVIAEEIRRVLHVTSNIPSGIDSVDKAIEVLGAEVDSVTKALQSSDEVVLQQKITQEQRHMLMHDMKDVLKLYMECYPDRNIEDAFVVVRDIARQSIYQTFFDQRMLTGSDHGILHAHGNCHNSEGIHEHMDDEDMPPMGRLLNKVIHYYHDIGYTVGASDFSVKKDHPYIGAAFIDANKEYFDHYFPPVKPGGANEAILPEQFGSEAIVPSDLIRNVILNHSVVYFDTDPNDLEKMIKFSVTNSDACAVSMHDKCQAIWRDHPETILPLMKMRKFVTLFPSYAGFGGKLANDNIMDSPWLVFPLKEEALVDLPDTPEARVAFYLEKMTEKENFKDPMDFHAYKVFADVKSELFGIFDKKETNGVITYGQKMAFKEAIKTFLNGIGAKIVVSQFGAKIDGVSCTKVHEEHDMMAPKYRLKIHGQVGISFELTDALISSSQAGKNFGKLADEYGGDEDELIGMLSEMDAGGKITAKMPTADMELEKVDTKTMDPKMAAIEAEMQAKIGSFVPFTVRKEMHGLDKALGGFLKSIRMRTEVAALEAKVALTAEEQAKLEKLKGAIDKQGEIEKMLPVILEQYEKLLAFGDEGWEKYNIQNPDALAESLALFNKLIFEDFDKDDLAKIDLDAAEEVMQSLHMYLASAAEYEFMGMENLAASEEASSAE